VTEAAFIAGNNTTMPAQFTPGLVIYVIDATNSAGRVTAYHIVDMSSPLDSNRERLALLAGLGLPRDAVETNLNNDTCLVWRSPMLKKLVGMEYAQTTTSTGSTSAEAQVTATPHC
jgi:hypothetical protein